MGKRFNLPKVKYKPYAPPVYYTELELLQADFDDMMSDARCALRDGLPDYARKCEQKAREIKERIDKLVAEQK